MEKVIFLHIFGLLFLTRGVGTSSVAVALFNDLSEKLVDLNLSFNTNINSIHERLNKIEGAIGIGEKNVDSDGDPLKAELGVGQTLYSDIIKTKERFMKALESEKRYMRKLVKENEEKFDHFKYDIMNTVSTISLTVQELNKTLVTGTDQSEIVADILNIQNRVATIEKYQKQCVINNIQLESNKIRIEHKHQVKVVCKSDRLELFSTTSWAYKEPFNAQCSFGEFNKPVNSLICVPKRCNAVSLKNMIVSHLNGEQAFEYVDSNYTYTVKCIDGYELKDDIYLDKTSVERSCEFGEFINVPKCVKKRCATWTLDKTDVYYKNNTRAIGKIDSHVEYNFACTSKYEFARLRGTLNLIRRCEFGRFINVPKCVPSQGETCGYPDLPANSELKTAVDVDHVFREGDTVRYKCKEGFLISGNIVRQCQNSIWTKARFTCDVPPSIAVAQRNVYGEENRNAELRCDASGGPAPIVSWEKEGGQLPAQHNIQDGILTIYGVRERDAGRYICTASSSSGSSRDYAVLHVSSGSGIDTSQNHESLIVNVGDRVSLECIVTGTPLPTITWSRDDGPLPEDVVLGDGILIIPQAKVKDAGTYTCLAVNEAGSIRSKTTLYFKETNFKYQVRIQVADRVNAGTAYTVYVRIDGQNLHTKVFTMNGHFRRNKLVENEFRGIDVGPIRNVVVEKDKGRSDDNVMIEYVSIYIEDTDDYYLFTKQDRAFWLKADTPTSLSMSGHPERCVHTYGNALNRTPKQRGARVLHGSLRECKQRCVTTLSMTCNGIYFMPNRNNRDGFGRCYHYTDSPDSNKFRDNHRRESRLQYVSYKRTCRQP